MAWTTISTVRESLFSCVAKIGDSGPLDPVESSVPLKATLTAGVSVNTAVAVRLGQHRITYQPNPISKGEPEELQLRVDGELKKLNAKGLALAGGGRILSTIAPGGIQIESPGET